MPEIPGCVTRELYGGALNIALPPQFVDISNIRQVPDNQEVFINQENDQSIMIDLLEYQEHVQGVDAINYHFQEIANCNEATNESAILNVTPLQSSQLPLVDPSFDKFLLVGQQRIAKFKEDTKSGEAAKNFVGIYMVLIRLAKYGTDIVITFNTPQYISEQSSSLPKTAEDAQKYALNTLTPDGFLQCLATFAIIDTSLFVN